MVTDEQNKQNKTNKKGKNRRRIIGGAKFLSKYMSGLAPSKEDVYRRSYSESKIASSMTANFPRAKLRQVWLRIFRKQNCVKGDCEFLASKTASKVTANFFKSKLRQIWLRIFSQHLSLKSLLAPSSWDRINDPQLAEVVLKPTYCWSCYVSDVCERAADQMTK